MRGLMVKTSQFVNARRRPRSLREFADLLKKLLTKQVTLPVWALFFVILACVYIIAPIDTLPDVIPVIGMIDDAIVALSTLNMVKPFVKFKDKTQDV